MQLSALVEQKQKHTNRKQKTSGNEQTSYVLIYSLKVTVRRIFPDPRFLLFVSQSINGYKHKIKYGWMTASVNEIAPFEPYAAVVKGKTTLGSDGI